MLDRAAATAWGAAVARLPDPVHRIGDPFFISYTYGGESEKLKPVRCRVPRAARGMPTGRAVARVAFGGSRGRQEKKRGIQLDGSRDRSTDRAATGRRGIAA